MGINPYFGHNRLTHPGEQELVDDLIIEAIQIYGQEVYYLPRTAQKKDQIFGEDVLSSFDKAYLIEMYLDSVEGFDGERNFLSRFGLEIRKQANFTVSKRRFNEVLKLQGQGSIPPPEVDEKEVRPKEGDLIWHPLTQDLWEIRHADHEVFFYQLGKVFVWRLSVEKFVYSNQPIDTGVDVIDAVEDRYVNQDDLTNELLQDNDDIETEDDAAGDFDENNPFGNRQ